MRSLRHLAWLAVACAAMPAALTAPAAASTDRPDTRHACQQRLMGYTLRTLHTSPRDWRIHRISFGAWGATWGVGAHGSRVYISPTAPCDAIPSIVNHEWMHTLQYRYYGTDRIVYETVEIEADCGSWLLGSDILPYADDGARRTGSVGCDLATLGQAERLIRRAGVTPVRSIYR